MKWLNRLLGRRDPTDVDEAAADRADMVALHDTFDRVQRRTIKLEAELRRVNADLRRAQRVGR